MGARFPSVFSTTILANVPASGAQTVVLTTPPLTLPYDGAAVYLIWSYGATIGTGTTAATMKITRGATVNDLLIFTGVPASVTAGNVVGLAGTFIDVNPGASTPQYSLNLLGTNTTGAWGAGLGSLMAFAL